MPLQIDWVGSIIQVTSPTTSLTAQALHDFVEDQMATPVGNLNDDILQPEGKIEDPTNPGVYSQIILYFNSPWQIQFWGGSGYTRIYGGKVIGGLGDQPLKATGTAGDISVLESPVDGITTVVETGVSGLTATESQQLADAYTEALAAKVAALAAEASADGADTSASAAALAAAAAEVAATTAASKAEMARVMSEWVKRLECNKAVITNNPDGSQTVEIYNDAGDAVMWEHTIDITRTTRTPVTVPP